MTRITLWTALLIVAVAAADAKSDTSFVMSGCPRSALITRSQTTYQMLCQSKTGTTVMDWVVRRLFEKTSEIINECKGIAPSDVSKTNPNSAVFVSKTDYTGVLHAGNSLYFSRRYKHDSYWRDILTRDTVQDVADECTKKNIPMWTKDCLDHFGDLRSIKSNASDFSIVMTMRDPISIAESGLYFANGEISDEHFNELMLGPKGCRQTVGQIALRYSLAYLLRAYGFDIRIFFYEDFRRTPKTYLYEFTRFLGLEVEDYTITEVLEETSINASKKAQEEIDNTPESERTTEMKRMWRGIGDNPHNYRKVRSGEVQGYLKTLTPEVLTECVKFAQFHLPPELKFRYFPDPVELSYDHIG